MPKITRKQSAKKNVPWEREILPVSSVNAVARDVYAKTAGFGHRQTLIELNGAHSSIESKFTRKQLVIEKIKDNFRDPFSKINKTLLHKYVCPTCKKSLQACFKSIPQTNVILDCEDDIHGKINMH